MEQVRKSPTQKQTEKFLRTPEEELIDLAIESLHSLNRRAKKIRDNRNQYRRASFSRALDNSIEEIYSIKDKFLEVMVLSNKAKIEFFHNDFKKWFLISCGKHSFHQPNVSYNIEKLASKIDAHDPYQPQKEIPKIGLTIEAQKNCVKIATKLLKEKLNNYEK